MNTIEPKPDQPATPLKRGGRPKQEQGTTRETIIGVRVSPSEHEEIQKRAKAMNMPPAQWLRHSALTRRLPSPPVSAINREQYAELARLSANLNQLAKAANDGRSVTVNSALLEKLATETKRLRLALLGKEAE